MAAHASALSPVELSHRELLDVDAQAESLPGWEQEYQQLSAGAYRGEVLHCGLPGANVFIETCNRSVYQRGSAPEGAAALALPLDAEGAGWHAGHVFDVDTMIVLAEVYQTDMGRLSIGQGATITADGFNSSLRATLTKVLPQVQRQSTFAGQPGENMDQRVFEVRLQLHPTPEQQRKLSYGSNLQVNVVFDPPAAAAKP